MWTEPRRRHAGWLRALAGALLLACLAIGPASVSQVHAQARLSQGEASAPDYSTWESVARRAEAAVDAQTDASAVYETLRERIAGFRASFDTARQVNSDRIATLRGQIAALGPPPEGDLAETAEIATRRAALSQQLAALLAPVQAAEEAFTRADGLIRQIDAILRERQQQRLLALGPSPLIPTNWPGAVTELAQGLQSFLDERSVLNNPALRAQARETLPLALLLLLCGLVLIARGRSWAAYLGSYMRRFGGRGSGVWSFTVSLLRIALPLAGVYALTEAVRVTGLVGVRTGQVLDLLPVWAGLLLGYRWLAERVFSRTEDEAILPLEPKRRSEARFYMTLLALFAVLRGIVELVFETSDMSASARAVVAFPIVVVIGLLLFRFGQLLRGFARSAAETSAQDSHPRAANVGFTRLLRSVGLGLQVIGVLAPVMSGLGYAAAGNTLLFPSLLSIGLLGLVLVLQQFFTEILGYVTGQGAQARDTLLAVLINAVLVLAATPVLALIWGARVADLTELWTAFLRGFEIGDTRISPTDFLAFALLFAVGYLITRLVQNALKTSVLPKTRLDQGAQTAAVSGVGYIGIFLSVIVAVTMAGIDLSALAIVAGALSVGIGFGLQNIVNNFVSGIILLIERPIAEGDWIEVNGNMGYVRAVSVRSTRIETFDRSDVIVPNSDLISGTVTNYTRGNTVGRVIVPVGVAYGTDTRKVEDILREIAQAHPMVLADPPPAVFFLNFGASSLDFEIRAILRDVNWMMVVKSEMNHQIARRFAEEGIEIPFPQQDIWLRNPERLRTPPDLRAEDVELAPIEDEVGQTGETNDADSPGEGHA